LSGATKERLTAGVLGGMGPAATVDFMARVVALTPAERDQDHVRMLVDNNPQVPNRQAAIRSGSDEVARVLADMARRLEAAGADFLVMPCNSAHAFARAIRATTRIPLVSIIDESVREVRRVSPGARRVGVLATDGLLEAGIFQQALATAGYEPLVPDAGDVERLMAGIHRIKAGESGEALSRLMAELVQALAAAGAQAIIAGCTEIPLVLRAGDVAVPVVSSTDVLARRTVELATGAAPLPDTD
jgi:aspartate racemase